MPEHVEQAYRRYDTVKLALLIVVTVFVAACLELLVYNSQINRANGQRLIDCTTPKHPCYEQSQRRQAQVIGDPPAPINTVIVLAAACADKPGAQTQADIRACVLAGLRGATP